MHQCCVPAGQVAWWKCAERQTGLGEEKKELKRQRDAFGERFGGRGLGELLFLNKPFCIIYMI